MSSATRALLPIIALVVGFVAGTGFGVVVLSGDPAEPVADYDSASSGRRSPPDDPSPEPEHKDAPRRRGVSTDDVLVENALRGSAGMPATRGQGVVTGRVLDQLGNPVEGVVITATTDIHSLTEPPEGLDEAEGESLEARVRRLVWEHRFGEATRAESRTGPDGTYRLEELVDASYYLEPALSGWRFTVPGNSDWNAAPGESLDFTAHPVIGVAVAVMMPDGTTPDTASLWYTRTGSNDSTSMDWTPDSDPLELSVGHYTFSASAGPHLVYAVNEVAVEVAEDGSALVELRLQPRPGVWGKIEFPGEERPLSVGIAALSLSSGGDVDESHLMTAPNISWTADPFEYTLLDLEPGAYLVGAVLRNGVVLGSAMIDVSTEPIEHVFSVGNVDVRDYIVVRPRSPDGSPVGDITFTVGYSDGEDLSFEGNLNIAPEEDGSFHVPLAMPGGPEDGYNGWSRSGEVQAGADYRNVSYFLTAHSSRFGQKRVEYDARTDRELDVLFSEPAWAVVTVSGYVGGPWRGRIEATLVPVGEGGQMTSQPWIDDDQRRMTPQGVARVGPVEPGTYMATLMVLTPQSGYRQVAQTEVVLGVGETQLTMSVPDLHDLTMVVDGEHLDLDLHRDPGPNEATDFLDEGVMNGRETVFAALVPGRYRVRHYGEGSTGEMIVDVPAAGPVRFVPRPYDSLRVEWVPEGLENDLQQGDIILAIGDHEMEGERRVRAARALAQTTDTVRLSVRRGSRVFDLEIPSAPLENANLAYWVR